MHKDFRKLLNRAKGESQLIIAVIFDIRGFSPFCEREDSVNVAAYITKVYKKIIDDYFPNASFFKSAGDGLVIIQSYDEKSLNERAKEVIEICLKLSEDFQDFFQEDEMINFETPKKIGIGIARGNACCIASGGKILDYSGKVLNLASRLMDMARPSGIVFDSRFGFKLLSEKTKKSFIKDSVYVRGIAEKKPINIYYTKDYTLIPESYKHPIKEPKWETVKDTIKFKDLKAFPTEYYTIPLKQKPIDVNKIQIAIEYPYTLKTGIRITRVLAIKLSTDYVGIDYEESGKSQHLDFRLKDLCKLLNRKGAKDEAKILFKIDYPVI